MTEKEIKKEINLIKKHRLNVCSTKERAIESLISARICKCNGELKQIYKQGYKEILKKHDGS